MNHRTLDALQALAERPGTAAEGEAARAALKRLRESDCIDPRTPADAVNEMLRHHGVGFQVPQIIVCQCGNETRWGDLECCDLDRHEAFRAEVRQRFPRGVAVYYNDWCYPENAHGIVTGYPAKPFKGDWHWIRVKFDHLKQARSIPTRSAKGWHLSTEPVSRAENS